MRAAECQVGVTEHGGNNHGPEVEQYLKSVKLGPSYPWCAAFIHWSYRQCGTILKPEREFAAAAKYAQSHVVWEKAHWTRDTGKRISKNGDVGTLWYSSLNRVGHCFLIEDESDDYVTTIEGNTSPEGSRDGGGVYRRKRLKKSIYRISRW